MNLKTSSFKKSKLLTPDSELHFNTSSSLCLQDSESPTQSLSGDETLGKTGLFKSEEDMLTSLTILYKRDWEKIEKRFNEMAKKKFSKQILQSKYDELSNFKLKGTRFTEEDDEKLRECVEKYGMNWVKISSFFPDRCPISLRNRYYKIRNNPSQQKVVAPQPRRKIIRLNTNIQEIEFDQEPEFLKFIENMAMNLEPLVCWKAY